MRLTKNEWENRAGTAEFNNEIALGLKAHGYVILESALSSEKVADLRATFLQLLDAFRAHSDANRGANRFLTHLPVEGQFADPELLRNPLIMPLLEQLLGRDLACTWCAVDTPLGGSQYQPAHSDGRPLFPASGITPPAVAYVANFSLVEFREDNGPLEIWPNGSHLISDVRPAVGAEGVAPTRVLMPEGSLLLRDSRMWHRGSPNTSGEARPMLAFVYHRSWYRFAEAEAGGPVISIDPDVYSAMSEEMQRQFRFALVPGGLTKRHIEECSLGKIGMGLAAAGFGGS